MQNEPSDLVVRRHERLECALPSDVSVFGEHAEHVALSRATLGPTGAVPATLVDCSAGGVGLRMGVFLPKGCRVNVRVRLAIDGVGTGESIGLAAQVARVRMVSQGPEYYMGCSFEGDGDQGEQVDALIEHVRRLVRKGEEGRRSA